MPKRILRKIKPLFMALFLVFGTMMVTTSFHPIPIHAEEMGGNEGENFQDNQRPENNDGLSYDENGILERFVVGLYDVELTIFGADVNFNDLGLSLNEFIDFDSSKQLQIVPGENADFNLYKIAKEKIYPAVKGMGISLLTMMMMWKFVKECLEVERFSWERAMMLMAKCFMVNMFINYSFEILELFFGWVMDALELLIPTTSSNSRITNVGQVFAAGITHERNPIHQVIIMVVALIFAFMYYGTCIAVISQVIVRYVKILIGMAFAPIPLAISVDEQHGTDVMRYIFWMTGAFLQAPIIKLCLYIYSLLLSDLGNQIATMPEFGMGSMIPVCLMMSLITGLLAAMINMAQQVTDRIMPA